ncbi:uncharacterized protein LOC130665363 [Microplitis mediator]|uniref:uncharacterized protein LOC130665363 n=1 Tax=Microplitis mediator TaxID=375433 RepID=UPI0025573080|nr:uncharacterized protein LOC130665363 [Microplitis mediator]
MNPEKYTTNTFNQVCYFTLTISKKNQTTKMSKVILLLLSIFLIIGLYASAAEEGCPGKWCHSSQGYGCCEGFTCSSDWFQGNCMSHRDWRKNQGKLAANAP